MEQVNKAINTAWGMFKRFGVRSVTMDDVAREMAVSKKTLYRCFRDKEDMINCVMDYDQSKIKSGIESILTEEKNPVRQVIQIAQYVSGYLKDLNPGMMFDLRKYHPEIYDHVIKLRNNTFLSKVTDNLQRGVKEGFYRDNINVSVTARLYLLLMTYAPDAVGQFEMEISFADLYLEVIKYHLHSVCTAKGLEEARDFLK